MHRFVEIWTSQSPKSRLIRHCRSCLCHMCFPKEKHSTSKSSQVHKNTFCSSFVHQLTTHVTHYAYWDLSTNSCRGFFRWVFFESVVSCRPVFYVVFYYFFMKTCDVRQRIKNLNGFSFSASILCNVIKMRQLIWSFWFNIQFKTYRRVLRGWPMVFGINSNIHNPDVAEHCYFSYS